MKTITLGILTGILLSSCSKQSEDEFIFPLAEDTRLEITARTVRQGAGVDVGSITQRVAGVENINGKDYQKIVTVYEAHPGAEPWISYVRYAPDGLYRIEGKHKDKPEYLAIPLPIVIGSTWTEDAPESKREVTAVAIESLELPDRSYDRCLRLSYRSLDSSKQFEGEIFFASGIGLVKEIRREPGFVSEATVNYK